MRISGITIPDAKKLEIGLTELYGIGRARAQSILDEANVDRSKKAKDLTEAEETRVRQAAEAYKIEGDLKRQVQSNIKRLKDIKAYRGLRHSKGITVRGQKTKTNARTVPSGIYAKKRTRATMGSGRRKVEKK